MAGAQKVLEIRDLFEREGIKFAHRGVTVQVVDDNGEKVTPAKRDAALGAAHAAIEDDLMNANDGGTGASLTGEPIGGTPASAASRRCPAPPLELGLARRGGFGRRGARAKPEAKSYPLGAA